LRAVTKWRDLRDLGSEELVALLVLAVFLPETKDVRLT